jgi:hypothetical protein
LRSAAGHRECDEHRGALVLKVRELCADAERLERLALRFRRAADQAEAIEPGAGNACPGD